VEDKIQVYIISRNRFFGRVQHSLGHMPDIPSPEQPRLVDDVLNYMDNKPPRIVTLGLISMARLEMGWRLNNNSNTG